MRNEALNVYEIFKKVLGEDQAKVVIGYLENTDNKSIETAVSSKTESLATKEQLYLLREDVQKTKAEIIKWMFIFWVGNVGTMIAIIKLFQ